MVKIGIIGGVGPHPTSVLYEEIIKQYSKATGGQHPEIIIHSIPTDPIMVQAIINDDIEKLPQKTRLINILQDAINSLKASKVDHIIIPSNTVWLYAKNITKDNLLNPIEASINHIKAKGYKQVLLVCTSATRRSQYYQDLLKKENIECILPDDNMQKTISETIYHVAQDHDAKKITKLLDLLYPLFGKADAIILGCTDLNLPESKLENFKIPVVDSLDCVTRESIRQIFQKI